MKHVYIHIFKQIFMSFYEGHLEQQICFSFSLLIFFSYVPFNPITRTHSMACHRKSPRSRRNLMVIDPLTPSQGHQFYRRLNCSVYHGLLLIPFKSICHMTMFRKLNFLPLPKAPGGGVPKNCAGACAIDVSDSHTKSG